MGKFFEKLVFLRLLIIQEFAVYTDVKTFCSNLNHKTAGGRGGISLTPPCGFWKSASSKEKEKPWFFVTFNIILRHIFPENFIEFPQVVQ